MNFPSFQKTYGKQTVLEMPAFSFEKGKTYAVIGANGSGKSTLASILAGLVKADSGRVSPSGGEKILFMPQKSYPFRMSVKKNLLLAENDAAKAQLWMDALQISHLASRRANRLSGGETSRTALARVLMQSCDLLVLDEPTAALDIESSKLAESAVACYRQETGAAVLLITHSLRQAERMADFILFFHKGKLLEWGEAEELLRNPKCEETRQFIDFYEN